MKTLLMLVSVLIFSNCSALKPGCIIQDKLSAIATDVIVEQLECTNSFAVKMDMDEVVKKLGLCKTGPLADVVCPTLVDVVVNRVLAASISKEWACNATQAKDKVKNALTIACKQIPVSKWTAEKG